MARLNKILCQLRQLWRKTSRATRRLVEPLDRAATVITNSYLNILNET
jgi:hypothetical protein